VFFPARSLAQVIAWVARCRMRRQFQHRRLRFARGRQVSVRSERSANFQLDGDPPGVVHEMLPSGIEEADQRVTHDEAARPLHLRIGICPGLLPVLTVRD
jgi:hypothetical protein